MNVPFHRIRKIDFKTSGLTDNIYSALADVLVGQVFKGGERLVETDLQKHFGVSRSPIREAFRKLETKGLVEIIPRKGTFVKRVKLKDIENSFDVRAVLEGLAAKKAQMKMSDQDRAKLERTFRHMIVAAQENNPESMRKSVYQFHKAFILSSGNDFLINVLRYVPIHQLWKRFLWEYSKADLDNGVKRYGKLLQMFLDKDFDAHELEKYMVAHVRWSGERFMDYLVSKKVFKSLHD